MFTPHALSLAKVPHPVHEEGAVGLVVGPGATVVVGLAVEPNGGEAMDEARRLARDAATLMNGGVAEGEWRAYVEAHERALCAHALDRDGEKERVDLARARAALLARLAAVPSST